MGPGVRWCCPPRVGRCQKCGPKPLCALAAIHPVTAPLAPPSAKAEWRRPCASLSSSYTQGKSQQLYPGPSCPRPSPSPPSSPAEGMKSFIGTSPPPLPWPFFSRPSLPAEEFILTAPHLSGTDHPLHQPSTGLLLTLVTSKCLCLIPHAVGDGLS